MAMLAYNPMSLFRQAVIKLGTRRALATLHHKVLAVDAFWDGGNEKNVLRLAVSRRRRQWFDGLCAQTAIDPGIHRFGHE